MYIGSANNVRRRVQTHLRELRAGRHANQHLQRAYLKYDASVFTSAVVEYVDDESRLLEREQVWLDFFKPVYNIAKVAGSPTKGLKFSAETRAKMSAAHKGRKRPPRPLEWNQKISAAKKLKGMSAAGLASFRVKRKLLFANPEYREKWAAVRRGYKHTAEAKAKIGLAHIGNTYAKDFKYSPSAYDSRRGPRKQRRVS